MITWGPKTPLTIKKNSIKLRQINVQRLVDSVEPSINKALKESIYKTMEEIIKTSGGVNDGQKFSSI